jgi:hypothetical protein
MERYLLQSTWYTFKRSHKSRKAHVVPYTDCVVEHMIILKLSLNQKTLHLIVFGLQ